MARHNGKDNFVSIGTRTEEEKKEICSKGGIASGKVRREKKAIREQLEMLLSLPLKDGKLKTQLKDLGIADEDLTNQMAMVLSMWTKATTKGDVSAFKEIRDSIGEKPVEVQQVIDTPIIKDDIE